MRKLNKVKVTFLSASLTLLIVSCAGTGDLSYNDEPINENLSENAVVVTGSRVEQEESRERPRRMAKTDRLIAPRNPTESKQTQDKKIVSWKPSSQSSNNAIIKVGDKEEIKPEALDIAVQVDGFRARVVIDGYYTNPHGRNLEGSFKFRLPDGAVPYFFAFGQTKTTVETPIQLTRDIDDSKNIESRLSPASLMNQRQEHWLAPKQAIMVSKEQAAYAYNDTVARQIDPALLEWAGAGVFSARVFPLLAKQTHRVVLGYDLDLKRVGSDLMLDLPLSNEAIEKRINLLVNSKGASAVKLNRIVNNELQTNEKISKNNELVKTSFSGKDYNGLRLTVENHGNLVLVGEDDAGSYFAKQWRVDLPQEASATKSRVVFAIDTSLSASSEKFHLWVKLINQILEQNQSEIEAFTLMSFSTQPSWWRESFVKNTSDQREKLKRYLNRLILEGATNLSAALDQAVSPRWLMDSDKQLKAEHQAKPFDLFLLSDGAVTWGERDPFFITESTRASNQKHRLLNQLFTYRFGLSGENKSLLDHLVREIGGGSYQLDHNTDMKELAIAHKMVPWKIENISLEGGKDILLAGRPNAVYPGQLLTIAGRTGEDFADSMTLSFAKGKEKVQIALPMSNRIDSELSPRTYGQIAVSQLESIAALEMKVASSFANHFRVPGKSSSLLMLESKEDYKRYKIKPEEDSYVVAHRYVSEIFSKLKAGFTKSLSSPKQRMKAQLAKLEKMKNIDFALPDAVSLLIDDLPESAFEMNRSAALVKKIDRRKVPQSYLKKLKPDSLSYDRLEKEATRRFSRYSPQDALKVLSSLIEQAPSDVAMLRDVAFASESWGLYQQAFDLHLIAANLRPFEPQSYTYLAKLAERLNRYDLALIYFEMGLASEWSNRFGDYSLIHKIDYANFLRKSVADQPPLSDQIATTKGKDSAESIEAKRSFYGRDYAKLKLKRLKGEINLEGSELIVAISWNTDRTDVDLHVLEPSGEECYYSHNKTKSGGMLTKDVTTGFGPEMYINKGAAKGKYDLLVNYFSSDRNKLGLKTKVLVRSIRHWGTDEETETTQTVVLKDQKEKQRVATVEI